MIELVVPVPGSSGEGPVLAKVTRRGFVFAMPSGDVELFRIGVLAEALHRTRYTLVDWQRFGWISKPSFLINGRGRDRIRFYSAQQVINANRLIVERHPEKIRFRNSNGFRDFLRELDRQMELGAAAARDGRNRLVPARGLACSTSIRGVPGP